MAQLSCKGKVQAEEYEPLYTHNKKNESSKRGYYSVFNWVLKICIILMFVTLCAHFITNQNKYNSNLSSVKNTYIITNDNLEEFLKSSDEIIQKHDIIKFKEMKSVKLTKPLVIDHDVEIAAESNCCAILGPMTEVECPIDGHPMIIVTGGNKVKISDLKVSGCTLTEALVIVEKESSLTLENFEMSHLTMKASEKPIIDILGSEILLKTVLFTHNLNTDYQLISIGSGSMLEVEDAMFEYNTIEGSTTTELGLIKLFPDSYSIIKESLFYRNKNDISEGVASSIVGSSTTIYLNDVKATENESKGNGGFLYCDTCHVDIYNSIFIGNKCNNEDCYGGAIDVLYSWLSISESEFKVNSAGEGGAMAAYKSQASFDQLGMETNHCGSGEYKRGGAIHVYETTTTVKSISFDGNSGYAGGAIYTGNSDVTILESNFATNFGSAGGAFFSYNTNSIIQKTIFLNNTAVTGGAIKMFGNGCDSAISKCTFSKNAASASGGVVAIYEGGKLSVDESKLTFNLARTGGCFCLSPGDVIVTKSTIISNVAEYCGSIKYEEMHPSHYNLIDCVEDGNTDKIANTKVC